ncbi:MAG: UTP--glucose-1-phosphate uridylyltransferase [Actinomycetota bacterium]
MTSTVRTAVIPAAGLGTRFLPATKAVPKEMLPVVDRPSIQWVVEEAVAAGIDDIVIITSPHKKPLEDHFDRMAELESELEAKGKTPMLDAVRRITDLATFHFTRQGAPLGLGHAVSMAARHVRDQPFAVLLPDELMPDGGETLRRMIEITETTGASVVSLNEVEGAEISNYGCAGIASRDGDVIEIDRIVEKPAYEDAPSNLRVTGRYVFTAEIFDHLARTRPGRGGEIQLTDAMAQLIGDPGLRGLVIDDIGFDAGQKGDWLRANVELALREDTDGSVAAMLRAALGD